MLQPKKHFQQIANASHVNVYSRLEVLWHVLSIQGVGSVGGSHL